MNIFKILHSKDEQSIKHEAHQYAKMKRINSKT